MKEHLKFQLLADVKKKIKLLRRMMWKGGPGAAVEPTVCNRKVPGSSPSLYTFVWVRLEA